MLGGSTLALTRVRSERDCLPERLREGDEAEVEKDVVNGEDDDDDDDVVVEDDDVVVVVEFVVVEFVVVEFVEFVEFVVVEDVIDHM